MREHAHIAGVNFPIDRIVRYDADGTAFTYSTRHGTRPASLDCAEAPMGPFVAVGADDEGYYHEQEISREQMREVLDFWNFRFGTYEYE